MTPFWKRKLLQRNIAVCSNVRNSALNSRLGSCRLMFIWAQSRIQHRSFCCLLSFRCVCLSLNEVPLNLEELCTVVKKILVKTLLLTSTTHVFLARTSAFVTWKQSWIVCTIVCTMFFCCPVERETQVNSFIASKKRGWGGDLSMWHLDIYMCMGKRVLPWL